MFYRKFLIALFYCSFIGLFSTIYTVNIFYAIEQRDSKQVKLWMKSKPDMTITDKDGQTVLHAAVLEENFKIVKAVLKSDIHVNTLDIYGKTALDYAVEYGYTKIIVLLVQYESKVTSMQNAKDVERIVEQQRKSFWFKLGLKLALWVPLTLLAGFFVGCWIAELFGLCVLNTVSTLGYCIISGTMALAVSFLIPWFLGIPLSFLFAEYMIGTQGMIVMLVPIIFIPLGVTVWILGDVITAARKIKKEEYFLFN